MNWPEKTQFSSRARCVGKNWLVRTFAENEYRSMS